MDPSAEGNGDEEQEVIDPVTLKPQLYAAASVNNTEQVLQYLDMGVPVNHLDQRSGFTALHWAALNGNVRMVKRLLECGASESYHTCKMKQKSAALRTKKKDKKPTTASTSANGGEGSPGGEGQDEEKTTTEDAANGEAVPETKDEDNDENEEDDHFESGLTLEVTHDFTKNTPLLWATQRGHLRVIWLLLSDHFSPNDTDKMGNNALHLAAAYGDAKILQILINDGGNANVVNHYKNLPIDMAKNKTVRDMLAVAMVQGASMTDDDRTIKHDQTLKQYQKMTNTVIDALNEASIAHQNMAIAPVGKKINRLLMDAIDLGKENALDEDYIKQAEALLKKIEVSQDLLQDITSLQQVMPIKDQTTYMENIYKLEKSIEKAIENGIDQNQIQLGLDLIGRCQIEYWLSVLLDRLKDVTTASDANEHDMNKLRSAIDKAQNLQADEEILERAFRFLRRLDAELGMNRALKAIPIIKMPMENPPEGYYTEKDTGHIKETEGYPAPPVETGEYVWIPAESMTNFVDAINRLKSVYQGAESLGANATIIQESKDRLTKAEKEIKQLEAKDANDKNIAIEAAKKLAKRLKSGKGKKK